MTVLKLLSYTKSRKKEVARDKNLKAFPVSQRWKKALGRGVSFFPSHRTSLRLFLRTFFRRTHRDGKSLRCLQAQAAETREKHQKKWRFINNFYPRRSNQQETVVKLKLLRKDWKTSHDERKKSQWWGWKFSSQFSVCLSNKLNF